MGHAIEQIALQRGHQIVIRITSANRHELAGRELASADVAIEFTGPESGRDNVLKCLAAGVAVVSGTTGWNMHLGDAYKAANDNGAAFLHASNFSLGVNIFFEVNKLLASLMNDRTEYNTSIEETHHTQKKDAPSGTAITLAEQIIGHVDRIDHWELNGAAGNGNIPIIAHRLENVPGTHKIAYTSSTDDIEITHTAHNRDGFAMGAVLAAEYIAGKNGVFFMKDVLGIRNGK
jgi:4-hydroxy-tetrahydrodipicolinate reductase